MKYKCSNITANAIASTDSVWTTEMTVDTA
jgi:hypothetical protein